MELQRRNLDALEISPLPDGSKVIVDRGSETVFALNATAGAAFDACTDAATLAQVTERMQSSFGPEVTEELVEQAILQLEEKNLVTTTGSSRQATRRQVLGTLGTAIALPLVVSLTLSDQKAYAGTASSSTKRIPPPPPPPPPPPKWWPW